MWVVLIKGKHGIRILFFLIMNQIFFITQNHTPFFIELDEGTPKTKQLAATVFVYYICTMIIIVFTNYHICIYNTSSFICILYFFLFCICHVPRVENGEWGRHNIFMASTKFMVHARSTHHWKDRLTNKDRQCKYIEANTNMHIRNQRYKQ